MKKLVIFALLAIFVMPLVALQVWAAEKTAQAVIVDAGNKLCPVSGDPVSGKNFVVYQGKRYGLCCPMCEAPFLKDPAKYIAQMTKQKTATASTVSPADSKSKEMERDMEQRDF